MEKNKYPRVGSINRKSRPKGLCKICKQPKADTSVDVEWSIFRGDDDVLDVHIACWKPLKSSEEKIKALYGNR